MGEKKAEEFLRCMGKYSNQLSRWVIGGAGGKGKRIQIKGRIVWNWRWYRWMYLQKNNAGKICRG